MDQTSLELNGVDYHSNELSTRKSIGFHRSRPAPARLAYEKPFLNGIE